MDLSESVRKYIIENSSKSVQTLRKNLADRNEQVSAKQIKDFIKTLNLDNIKHYTRDKFNKMVVFPYIGAWFFDIGFSAKQNKNEGMWAIFCHGNSGYIVPYIINAKTTANLQKVVSEFVSDCKHLEVAIKDGVATKYKVTNYPVRTITADEEKGLMGVNVPGVEIKQFNAQESHRTLSRINGFMKHLKDYALKETKVAKQEGPLYVSPEMMANMVREWNTREYRALNCTPGEILLDRELEEAYICRALYVNEGKDAIVADTFETGMTVKVRNDTKNVFGRQKEGAMLDGHFVVDELLPGNRVRLHNALNSKESFITNLNYVESGGKTQIEQVWNDLEGTTLPQVNPELVKLPKEVLTKKYSKNLDRSYVALTRRQTKELGLEEPQVTSVVNSRSRKNQKNQKKNQKAKPQEKPAEKPTEKEPELQVNLAKEVNHQNPVEPLNKPLTINDLPYAEKERIAKLVLMTQREQDFQRGFAMSFSDQKTYNELNEIVKKLDQKELDYFSAVPKKKVLTDNISDKAAEKLRHFVEEPEVRKQDIWNSNGFEISGRMLKTKNRVS